MANADARTPRPDVGGGPPAADADHFLHFADLAQELASDQWAAYDDDDPFGLGGAIDNDDDDPSDDGPAPPAGSTPMVPPVPVDPAPPPIGPQSKVAACAAATAFAVCD